MQELKKRIKELEEKQLELKRWAQDLRCEATSVLLDRAHILRELDELKRQVFITENGVTKLGKKEVTDYNKKITKLINGMSEDQLQNLTRMLIGKEE